MHFLIRKKKSKNLLENNLFEKNQPTEDLLEVFEELESHERPVANEGQVGLQLKSIPSVDARKLAQMPESSKSDSAPPESDLEIEEIDQGDVKNTSNFKVFNS